MLGLGNALTRSINFGLLGEASIFNNSPVVGSDYEGGVVLTVAEASGQEGFNAVVTVGYPYLMQFPTDVNGEDVYRDKEYLNQGIQYIRNNFSYMKGGEVYNDWDVAVSAEVEIWLDNVYNPNVHSTDFFLGVSNQYLQDYDSLYNGTDRVTLTSFDASPNAFRVYHKSDYLTNYYNPTYDFLDNNPVYLIPVRRIQVDLEYDEQIEIVDNSSTSGTQAKNIGNGLFDLSINNFNEDSLNKKEESFSSNYNSLNISTKNGTLSFTIKFSLGNNPDPALVAQKLQDIPRVWRDLKSVYAEFNLSSLYHTDPFSFFTGGQPVSINYLIRYLDETTTSQKVQVRKANQNDFYGPDYFINNDIVYYAPNFVISEIFVARVFELDISNLPALPLLFSLMELGYQKFYGSSEINSVYHDGSTVTLNEVLDSSSTIGDVHFSQGASTPLPKGLWWGRFKVEYLKFTSPQYIESDVINTPPTLQNILVPMIPNIGGTNISIGTELEDDQTFYRLSDFFASFLHPVLADETKTMNVVGSAKYAVADVASLDNIDTDTLEIGDNVFVGAGGNSYQTLYSWDGTDFNAVSASENDTYNFRGSMYKKGSSNYFLLDSTDIINYE